LRSGSQLSGVADLEGSRAEADDVLYLNAVVRVVLADSDEVSVML
jgi:hypothetical protein